MMNAQLDATLGPILKVRADQAGIILSNADGDEPGLLLNLIRHIRSIGYRPVMAGNLKGFLDRYRTAETQRGFAEKTGLNPVMCAAYADGTKLNLEACVVANATGMTVARRGMFGLACGHVKDVAKHIERHLTTAQLLEHPLVDYVLGAEPGSGVFVVGFNDEPAKQQYMQYLKMGDGPYYVFYTPHVLPHLEVPLTAARAVLFGDAAVAPQVRRCAMLSRLPSARFGRARSWTAWAVLPPTDSSKMPSWPSANSCCRWGFPMVAD